LSKKEELEVLLEQKAEELKEVHRQLQQEEERELMPEVQAPVPVQVALTALRVVHRSLRLEASVVISQTKGPEYGNEATHEENHWQKVRKLSKREEQLRDSCCLLISEYLDSARISLESHQTQDDHEGHSS